MAANPSGDWINSAETESVAVVIPTRSRPNRLAKCLASLAIVREVSPFAAYVCDSSPAPADRRTVAEVCERYEWVRLRLHDGNNVTAARNECARVAAEMLLVNVDDDLELERDAIEQLLMTYRSGHGWRVVSGSVSWGEEWTGPGKMRAIGYARPPKENEAADFVPGAFFLYPRAIALALPWNERIDQCTDIFMGALWRRNGVQILFAPQARARHRAPPQGFNPEDVKSTASHHVWRIYALLWDALIANPSAKHAISYEVLGFAASAKLYYRHPTWMARFIASWAEGHLRLIADWRHLRRLAKREAPSP
ncbi:MAG: glycosyltransferase [Solirubrobacterales bacterium]